MALDTSHQTLCSKGQDYYHTSGSGTDVREVMDKVATEVEHLVEERNNETNTRID